MAQSDKVEAAPAEKPSPTKLMALAQAIRDAEGESGGESGGDTGKSSDHAELYGEDGLPE